MMYRCDNCGKRLQQDAKFCSNCGTPIAADASPSKAEKTVKTTKTGVAAEPAQSGSDTLAPRHYRILGSSTAVALLITLAYYYSGFVSPLQGKSSQPRENPHQQTGTAQQQQQQPAQQQTPAPSADEIRETSELLKKDPENVTLNLRMGNLLFDSNRFEEAIPCYKKVVQAQPNNADVIVDLGVSHYNLQKFSEAEEYFSMALQVEPDHLNGLYNMGVVSLKVGQMEKLIHYWGKLIQMAPDSPQAQQAQQYLESLHQGVDQSGNKVE